MSHGGRKTDDGPAPPREPSYRQRLADRCRRQTRTTELTWSSAGLMSMCCIMWSNNCLPEIEHSLIPPYGFNKAHECDRWTNRHICDTERTHYSQHNIRWQSTFWKAALSSLAIFIQHQQLAGKLFRDQKKKQMHSTLELECAQLTPVPMAITPTWLSSAARLRLPST